ncbi:hypothetical protein ENUP19_0018G0034 [Entamoeba nuttalli]|uniref:Nuclease domain containing protein n=2 Tax=Entamoeba nuttalli TaxID=412467 RepID=K2HA19_ENTNP|nr:nuclease domain containing protein [Entamoeba nuttalli P19]EKE39439.1 nuclease domain containing protein [Entamoeba nuttalli P19]|eukprot:XP_008858224.1 nuclease domain containing protein [Entamoeba nuttalli P19]
MPAQNTQKKDLSKKVEKKPESEPKKEKKTFTAFVAKVKSNNSLVLSSKKDDKKSTVVLAYVDLPRYDTKEKKEEAFAYECNEILRKKLVTGKEVKFEIVSEHEGIPKAVVPFVKKENVVCTLIENGYASLKIKGKGKEFSQYFDAEQKAKDSHKGIFNDDMTKIAKKRPENIFFNEKETSELKGKTVQGYIKRVEAPSHYIIEDTNRRRFKVVLYGVNQMLRYNTEKDMFDFDDDARDAMKYINRYFNQRDVTVKVIETSQRVAYAELSVEKKDVAEELLRSGFVVCSKLENATEEIKQKYQAAEKEAKKEKKARWTEFDQAAEDAIIAKRQQKLKELEDRRKNAKIISGAEIIYIGNHIKAKKGNEEYNIHLASVRPVFKKNDKEFNDLVQFRIKECLRKLIVGKKFEAKECYKRSFTKEDKTFEEIFYDVYASGKNVAITLIKEGLVVLEKTRDEFYQSFDYKILSETPKGEYKEKAVTQYPAEKRESIKDVFLNNSFNCIVERVINVCKYVIYIPEKDCRMTVVLSHCRIPRDDENEELKKFNEESKAAVRALFGLNEVTVDFREFFKGNFCVDILSKKFDLCDVVLSKAYAQFAGRDIPENIAEMKENQEGIYKFAGAKKEGESKPVRPVKVVKEVHREIKFGEGKNVYITGFDGSMIYYYEKAADAKFIDELSNKLKKCNKGSVEQKDGQKCVVEIKGVQYRAIITKAVPTANVVKCIDTGAVIVCGKNKLKPLKEEFENIEVTVKSIALAGIKTLVRGKDVDFDAMISAVSAFFNKEATMFVATINDKEVAKVIVGDVCINTMLIQEGLSTLDRFFNDSSEWGRAMTNAQSAAKDKHLNVWRYGEIEDEEEKDKH